MDTPPAKRRALASLDANAKPSPKPLKPVLASTPTKIPIFSVAQSPAKLNLSGLKRPLEVTDDDDIQRNSPSLAATAAAALETQQDEEEEEEEEEETSLFDTTAADSSYSTAQTQDSPRQDLRQQAHQIQLRLRLAMYKLKSGQVDKPLSELRSVVRVDASRAYRTPSPEREVEGREEGAEAMSGLLSLARAAEESEGSVSPN